MHIEKRVLGDMPMPYSVMTLVLPGGPRAVFASEDREGPCILYDLETGRSETMWSTPGGMMNMVQDGDRPALWAIQRFFPIFQSAEAQIVLARRGDDGVWTREVKGVLPYVHRIARFHIGGVPHLLGCVLCDAKDFQDDWSHPGSVHVSPIVDGEPLRFRQVASGLSKNHGLTLLNDNGVETPCISCQEGVFTLAFAPDGRCDIARIHDKEASEALLYDLDGDGKKELVTIEGFHGGHIRVYRQTGDAWRLVQDFTNPFGHVVWVGEVLGRPCILSASRAEEREIALRFPNGLLEDGWGKVVVDAGVGATQIEVVASAGAVRLLAANHHVGQAVVYTIS